MPTHAFSAAKGHDEPVPRIHQARLYLAPFIGRQAELAEIERRLADPGSRLITLVGPGGIGKTRLALEAADRAAARYPDGVWLVELAGLSEPALVPDAVARAVGLREPGERPVEELLVAHLASRNLMILLDNCEHLHDTCAELAQRLLARCRGLQVLATSREPLGIGGELAWPVPPLCLAPHDTQAGCPTEDGALSEAAALFIDRAQRAWPSFSVDAGDLAAITEICRRLDALPLAIELAAAWVKVLSPAEIAGRLENRFRLLVNPGTDVPARHRTLEAALDSSHDLLSEPEQSLFRRLAVFAGTFDLQAAEAVGTGGSVARGDVLLLLRRLADKSLVGLVRSHGRPSRYRLLETVQHYGRSRLRSAGEEAAVRDRQLDHYLGMVEQGPPQLWGAGDPARLDQVELEYDNLRVVLDWSIESGKTDIGIRLAWAMGWFWYTRARLHEGCYWLDRLLEAEQPASPARRAAALNLAGALSVLQGEFERAISLLTEAIAMDCEDECSSLGAWSLHELGMMALLDGRYTLAAQFFQASQSVFTSIGDGQGVTSQTMYLGLAALYEGDLERGTALLRGSLPQLREAGDNIAVARALHGLGLAARQAGDLAGSRRSFVEALLAGRDRGATLEIAGALDGLAGIAGAERDLERAARLFGAADALRQAAGTHLPPGVRGGRDRDLAETRRRLGEERFAAAHEAGRHMALEQVMVDALAAATPAETAAAADLAGSRALTPLRAAKQQYGGLTERERQVAALIAQGKSNTAIAGELVLTIRTVEAHVTHILQKLEFESRTQIAVWAAGRGLADLSPHNSSPRH